MGMTEQEKREKVIKGLECCMGEGQCCGICDNCPYNTDKMRCNLATLHQEALELLKAQDAQIMTLEEVKMLDRDYYYLEAMRSPGKELREIVGAYGLECVTWPSITWSRQTMGDSGYGKTWRCWTSRPDQATREATPWN